MINKPRGGGRVFFPVLAILIFMNTLSLHAQTFPCDDTDIDNPCPSPLDNWVIYLAIACVFYAVIKLNKKNRRDLNIAR